MIRNMDREAENNICQLSFTIYIPVVFSHIRAERGMYLSVLKADVIILNLEA